MTNVWRMLGLYRRNLSCAMVCLLVLGGFGATSVWNANRAEANKRKTTYSYRKGGFLFAANTSFPTTAEDVNGFLKLGKKHSQENPVSFSEGTELALNILLVMKVPYRTAGVNLVLLEKGKTNHLDSQFLSIQKKTLDIFVSPLSFSSSAIKKGRTYELQATTVREMGKNRFHITVLARTLFRL